MKKLFVYFLCHLLVFGITGCAKAETEVVSAKSVPAAEQGSAEDKAAVGQSSDYQNNEDIEMKLLIGDVEIPVFWENCTAVNEIKAEVINGSIRVNMSMYGGWEQVGSLGRSYTRDDRQMTAVSGDIVLYGGNQIVVFYGANSWSYTKLGKMNLPDDEITKLLAKGDVILTITE